MTTAVFDRTYATYEVEKMLGVHNSTLRYWCLVLEKKGYSFTKRHRSIRVFYQRDIDILEKMRDALTIFGTTREEAVAKALGKEIKASVSYDFAYDSRLDLQGAIDAIETAIINLETATASTRLSKDERNELVEVLDNLKVNTVTLLDMTSSR